MAAVKDADVKLDESSLEVKLTEPVSKTDAQAKDGTIVCKADMVAVMDWAADIFGLDLVDRQSHINCWGHSWRVTGARFLVFSGIRPPHHEVPWQ
eukprot:2674103-Amphidinium_carterae.1